MAFIKPASVESKNDSGFPQIIRKDISQYALVKAEYSKKKYHLVEIDARNIYTEKDVFTIFVKALKFGDYFGWNWDAVWDCLTDPVWQDTKNVAVLIKDLPYMKKCDFYETFIKIMAYAIDFWKPHKVDFMVITFEDSIESVTKKNPDNLLTNDDLRVLLRVSQELLGLEQTKMPEFPSVKPEAIKSAIKKLHLRNYVQKIEGMDNWETTDIGDKFIQDNPELFKPLQAEYDKNNGRLFSQ